MQSFDQTPSLQSFPIPIAQRNLKQRFPTPPQSIIAEARASLRRPSRPFTPNHHKTTTQRLLQHRLINNNFQKNLDLPRRLAPIKDIEFSMGVNHQVDDHHVNVVNLESGNNVTVEKRKREKRGPSKLTTRSNELEWEKRAREVSSVAGKTKVSLVQQDSKFSINNEDSNIIILSNENIQSSLNISNENIQSSLNINDNDIFDNTRLYKQKLAVCLEIDDMHFGIDMENEIIDIEFLEAVELKLKSFCWFKDFTTTVKTEKDDEIIKNCLNLFSPALNYRLNDEKKDKRYYEAMIQICSILLRISNGDVLHDTHQYTVNICKLVTTETSINYHILFETLLLTTNKTLNNLELKTPTKEDDEKFELLIETLFLCLGSIYYLSIEQVDIQKLFLRQGGINTLDALLSILLQKDLIGSKVTASTISSILTQITIILRNVSYLSSSKKYRSYFIESKLTQTIMSIYETDSKYQNDEELVFGTIRILSKLSLQEELLDQLRGNQQYTSSLLNLLATYQQDEALILRICFILGNLTMKLSMEHQMIAANNGIEDLVSLLDLYCLKFVELNDKSNLEEKEIENDVCVGEMKETSDVLIKIIRLISNLAVDNSIGPSLVEMIELESLLIVLQSISTNTEIKNEELLLNITAAIANFTFYSSSESNCVLLKRDFLIDYMASFLLSENTEMVIESARVFGNISRFKDTWNPMQSKRVTELLTILLDHSDPEIVYQAGGVLMNVSSAHRDIILENDGVKRLVDVLETTLDKSLAVLVSKVLHNLGYGDHNMVIRNLELGEREEDDETMS